MTDYARSIRNILMILLVITLFIILQKLSHLLIPLALAILLTMLNLPVINFLERFKVPRILITILVSSLTIVVLWIVFEMVSRVIHQIIQDKEVLAEQLYRRINSALSWIGNTLPGLDIEAVLKELKNSITPGSIASIIGSLFGKFISVFGSSTLLFLLYYLFLLAGATRFPAYMEYVIGTDNSGNRREISRRTQKSISTYMLIKTLSSLLTGILFGLTCWIFGLRFALFWGFIAFLMNYIPSVGSIIATVFPLLMALIQFDSIGIILAVSAVLVLIQLVIGNIIDPMLMGNHLRFNTVSILFGLLFWGYLWGVPGMLLAVPFMVIIRMLLEKQEDFSILARIMSYPDKPSHKRRSLLSQFIEKLKKQDRN